MPFTNEAAAYDELLDKLRENRDAWDNAQTLAECQQSISSITGVDVAKSGQMVDEIRAYYLGNEDQALAQLRLTGLAWPAADCGLTGPEWQGYLVAELPGGQQMYAADRLADVQTWAEVEVSVLALSLVYDAETGLMYDEDNWYLPDGETVVTLDAGDSTRSRDAEGHVYVLGVLQDAANAAAEAADPKEAHFDPEEQRWQRQADDGAGFEHYHNEDGVWERRRGRDADGLDVWQRFHSVTHGWLAYDRDSETWLDPDSNEWRPHAQVGVLVSPDAGPDLGPDVRPGIDADEGADEHQELALSDLSPELQAFMNKLYELNPEHRKIPIATVLEVVAETKPYLTGGE